MNPSYNQSTAEPKQSTFESIKDCAVRARLFNAAEERGRS